MTAQKTQRLARIGSPGNGVSIAAVFGLEWIFFLAYSAHNAAVEAWKSCLRLWSAEFKRCTICDDELWLGDLVSCSNDENRHWYCLKCLESTTTAMITGDVAFSYDPRTTSPLCCYCLPSSSSILDTQSLSPQMRHSWDKAIITKQLQGLGLPLITCAHCGYVVVDEREDSGHRPAPDKSLIYTCPSCSAALVKDGGCNHCTCLCRAEYCHICHASLGRDQSSVWKTHFCDHFIKGGQGRCTQIGCRRCPMYSDRDDEGIRRRVEGEVTRRWKRQRVWNGIKSYVG
ncbi:hypothetical protein C8R44DRAFT_809155, partial [Mycena epipterygia]